MVVCWRSTCISCAHILQNHTEQNLILFAMQCCRAIICLLSFIFQPPAICYFYYALVLHTHFTHTLTIVFLRKGISESASREAEKKREKSLQLHTWLGQTRFSTLKGVVSTDGDGKRSSGVDVLAHNEPPSQVLALTSWCHMWLHVPYGVYLVFEKSKSVFCLVLGLHCHTLPHIFSKLA